MGLLWTFMGASVPYTIFAGLMELSAGLLLLFRRTASLGTLAAIPVLTNVVMLNFCYDVPVKLFSVHLLAMAVFLAVPDLGRLAVLLVLRRPVAPAADRPFFRRRRWRITALVVEGALAVVFTAFILHMGYGLKTFYDSARSPLDGAWSVDDLKIDGRARDARAAEDLQWRRLVFDYPTVMAIRSSSDSRRQYSLKLDAVHKTLALTQARRFAVEIRPHLQAARGEPSHPGRDIRRPPHPGEPPPRRQLRFPLVSRGFHWVNEAPFNR